MHGNLLFDDKVQVRRFKKRIIISVALGLIVFALSQSIIATLAIFIPTLVILTISTKKIYMDSRIKVFGEGILFVNSDHFFEWKDISKVQISVGNIGTDNKIMPSAFTIRQEDSTYSINLNSTKHDISDLENIIKNKNIPIDIIQ